jgi:hypothetical protein
MKKILFLFAIACAQTPQAQEEESVDVEALEAEQKLSQEIIAERPKRILEISTWKLLASLHDYVSIRMGIRDLTKGDLVKKHPRLWQAIREIFQKDPAVGQDLRSHWDRLGPRSNPAQIQLENRLIGAEKLMATKDYERALRAMMGIASSLYIAEQTSKLRYHDLKDFEHAIRISIAQNLYALGRYKEAALIYDTIPASFYDFAQVLYERIWTNYRAARVDWSLGHLISLSSGYFGRVVPPDMLLIGIYSALELCDQETADSLIQKFHEHRKLLNSKVRFQDVHGGDPVLLSLGLSLKKNEMVDHLSTLYSKSERDLERRKIANYLVKETERRRVLLRDEYEALLPFVQSLPQVRKYLIKKQLPARAENFDGPFKISKFSREEIWAEEIGYILHRPEKGCEDGKNIYELGNNSPELPPFLESHYYQLKNFDKFRTRASEWRMFFFPRY